jgi:hypothetical protein
MLTGRDNLEVGIGNVLFKQDGELRFLIAVNNGIRDPLEAHLSVDALDFDPGKGETEITVWEENVKVPSGHTLNVLARIPANEVKKHVHCREIRYEVKFKAAEPQPGRTSSFQSPRMVSTFEDLPHRSILEEELKRKKISAYRQYVKETK